MLTAIGRFFKKAKDAWEWYSLLVLLGILPGVPVVLGIFEGQPRSVLALYAVAAAAFWTAIFPEARVIVDNLILRRRRVRLILEPCCTGGAICVGVENIQRITIDDALVYADLVGSPNIGRVMMWNGMNPDEPLRLNPGPPHHHLLIGYPGARTFTLMFAYGSVDLDPGDYELILYVKGKDLTTPRQRLILSVTPNAAVVRFVE